MSDTLIAVKPGIAAKALISAAQYKEMCASASADPAAFWSRESRRITWMRAPEKTLSGDFHGDVRIKWFEDGTLNASANCLDRHLAERGDQVAIIFEGDDPGHSRHVTYRELHEEVCRLANVLKSFGVQKGDRVVIYLPMVVEAAASMLACARIGAIHTVVFGGFSPDSLAQRIQDAGAKVLITADEGRRGGRTVALKTNADAALKHCPDCATVLVVPVTGKAVPMHAGRDHDYAALMKSASPECPPT
jgi:acetyl-CoA synthetase